MVTIRETVIVIKERKESFLAVFSCFICMADLLSDDRIILVRFQVAFNAFRVNDRIFKEMNNIFKGSGWDNPAE